MNLEQTIAYIHQVAHLGDASVSLDVADAAELCNELVNARKDIDALKARIATMRDAPEELLS